MFLVWRTTHPVTLPSVFTVITTRLAHTLSLWILVVARRVSLGDLGLRGLLILLVLIRELRYNRSEIGRYAALLRL
jgi:hypothetical protein